MLSLRAASSTLSLAALSLAACASSYTMVGYDIGREARGAMSTAVGGDDGRVGSVAAGFGAGPVALEAVVHGHDLETTNDRWLSAAGGLELKVRVLQLGPTQTFVHGGALRALVLDRDAMAATWGAGYTYGATFAVGRAGIRMYLDTHIEEVTYGGSDVNGTGSIRATTAGLMLGR